MPHLEPEELALAALGEALGDAARDHLASCEQCTEEHDSLIATVSAGRAGRPDELVAAPASVWQAVSAELGLDPAVRPGGPARGESRPDPAAPDPAAPEAVQPLSGGAARRPRPSVRWLAVAAVAGLVVGGLGVRWWDGLSGSPAVVDRADLQALPDWPDASGSAVVEQAADGTRTLVVTLAGAGADDGYREVWLIDADVTKLVSVGVLHGAAGSFVLPQGLDLTEYPVVDVSEEPFDGDPAHSGNSIVRGLLTT